MLNADDMETMLAVALRRLRELETENERLRSLPAAERSTKPSKNLELALERGDVERLRRVINTCIVTQRMAALRLSRARNRDLGARLTYDADELESIATALRKGTQ